jgi:HD superfamily phosphohydrolase
MGTCVRVGCRGQEWGRARLRGPVECRDRRLGRRARRAWLDTGLVQKRHFEIRDPVHTFIALDVVEGEVVDSSPFQRLRHVHQLALSSLVYPGATHCRFEHSLGVMHLAGRIYDVVTRPDLLSYEVRDVVPERGGLEDAVSRSLLRLAALCHDMGHLPFSHAAEDRLLPDGWDHERITYEILRSPEMRRVWEGMTHRPDPDQLAKIALGPRQIEKLGLGLAFSPWEAILAEMVAGDSFGADRIDYLLRDSLHTGVAYGRFDHDRLIQTLRILPAATEERDRPPAKAQREPQLGITRGGVEAAEGLWLARYFMFSQVYFHPTRLIYDQHLEDFLAAWLAGGRFPTDVAGHLALTDAEVTVAMRATARDNAAPGHDAARRIIDRDHFRVVYQRLPADGTFEVNALYEAACERYGEENIRYGGSPRRGAADFPVRNRDGSVVPVVSLSRVLAELPVSRNQYVFAAPELRDEVERWLASEREQIIERALKRQTAEESLGDERREERS